MNDCITKCCTKCGIEYPKTEEFFYNTKYPNGKYYLKSRCKTCINEVNNAKNFKPVNSGDKICIVCGMGLPATTEWFYACKKNRDGLMNECKDCNATKHGRQRAISAYRGAPLNTKKCYACKCFVDLSNFCKNKNLSDGLDSRCNTCSQKYRKRYYADNSTYLKKYSKDWISNHRIKHGIYSQKWREANKGLQKANEALRRSLPPGEDHLFNKQDWDKCLSYWGNKCAICGQGIDLWTTVALDHWEPIAKGGFTVVDNILPLCHSKKGGYGACNGNKHKRDPVEWLIDKIGKSKAKKKLKEIEKYFEWVRGQDAEPPTP